MKENCLTYGNSSVVSDTARRGPQSLIDDLHSEKSQPPTWNFWKYLIDPNGQVVRSYSPQINVRQVYPDIQKLLVKHHLIDKSEL